MVIQDRCPVQARVIPQILGSAALGRTKPAHFEPTTTQRTTYDELLVQAKARKECGDTVEFRDNRIVYLVLPDTCDVVFDSTTVTGANRALRSYDDFEQDLNRHPADLDSRMLSLQSLLGPTGEIVSVLENLIR